jgi:lipid-A-disaccharide synthase
VRQHKLDASFLESHRCRTGPLVTILPGSRTQEVLHNFPWFLKAAAHVRQAVPEARFAVAAFKPKHAEMAREMAVRSGQWTVGGEQALVVPRGHHVSVVGGIVQREPAKAGTTSAKPAIDIYSGRTPELMHLATCCMACSGSVSMELLYYTKPTVIHYWISPLAYAVQKRFRKVKYITLVNLLSTGELYPADLSPYDPSQPGAEKVLFPEYLTCGDKSAAVAGHVIQWLTDPAALARQIAALGQLKAEVAHGGASARAAEYILRELTNSSRK